MGTDVPVSCIEDRRTSSNPHSGIGAHLKVGRDSDQGARQRIRDLVRERKEKRIPTGTRWLSSKLVEGDIGGLQYPWYFARGETLPFLKLLDLGYRVSAASSTSFGFSTGALVVRQNDLERQNPTMLHF